jgi:hypothetical protein
LILSTCTRRTMPWPGTEPSKVAAEGEDPSVVNLYPSHGVRSQQLKGVAVFVGANIGSEDLQDLR